MKTKYGFYFFCLCLAGMTACRERIAFVSLAGEWGIALDSLDKGEQEQWQSRTFTESICLPGSLQEYGYGDDVGISTPWTGQIIDDAWYKAPEYAIYRKTGNIKVPFWLNPDKHYVGAAWFQKKVTVPTGWEYRPIVLELERTHWTTELYVDGRKIGGRDALQVPHRYVLDGLTSGEHFFTLRVDNRLHVDVGINAHSVSDHTQTNWNGIIGNLKLMRKPAVYIDRIRTDPNIKDKSVQVKVFLKGKLPEGKHTLTLYAVTSKGKPVGETVTLPLETGKEDDICSACVHLGKEAQLWSEYTPNVYKLRAELKIGRETDSREVDFGLREFKTNGTRFEINGKPVFLRGTLECCIFPLTGYPSMDSRYWTKIYRTCKEYGLNHVRFHSWCPPEVAFHVADSMGVYLQVECGVWMEVGSGKPQDCWIKEESNRILEEYGNHPSFCLLAHGNEPGGSNQVQFLNDLVASWKAEDNRRVYTSSGGWPFVESADYCNAYGARIQLWGAGLTSIINREAPRTDYDFASVIDKSCPTVSHEVGQWCVYPNFKEIPKYTGVLKAKNLEIFQESLKKKGMGDLADSFLYASGRLQTLCYKADIEALLRTPGMAGFQLLDLHDFPGQGTALVGVLDPFWDGKGYVDGREYSMFCNATVPLARFPKMVYTNDEVLDIPLEIAHFGVGILKNVTFRWSVSDAQGHMLETDSKQVSVPLGNTVPMGRVYCDLSQVKEPSRLVVAAGIEGMDVHNQWNIYVYPTHKKSIRQPYITEVLDERAKTELEKGGNVLLLTYGKVPRDKGGSIQVGFSSIFWNTAWTGKQPPHTLGVYCDSHHPALRDFPNEGVSDYQWWDIVSRCQAMVLDDYPQKFAPIIYLVDDWVTNRKLGLLYEARIGKGKLMVCSSDIQHDLERRPAAAQFRQSILEYMASDHFLPAQSLTWKDIQFNN